MAICAFGFEARVFDPGNGVADRLPIQMAANVVIIKQESHYKEHWYDELVPWKHYIPVKYDLSDLHEVSRFALSRLWFRVLLCACTIV